MRSIFEVRRDACPSVSPDSTTILTSFESTVYGLTSPEVLHHSACSRLRCKHTWNRNFFLAGVSQQSVSSRSRMNDVGCEHDVQSLRICAFSFLSLKLSEIYNQKERAPQSLTSHPLSLSNQLEILFSRNLGIFCSLSASCFRCLKSSYAFPLLLFFKSFSCLHWRGLRFIYN